MLFNKPGYMSLIVIAQSSLIPNALLKYTLYPSKSEMAAVKEAPERPSVYFLIKEVMDTLCLEDKVKSNKEGSSEDSLEQRCAEACQKRIAQSSASPLAMKTSFEDAAARMAHVYLHFTKNAYLVNSVISDAYAACTHVPTGTTVFNEVMKAIDWGRLSVFSLGGGAGADIFGILMFLHKHGFNAKVSGSVADKCSAWEQTSSSIFKSLNATNGETKIEKDKLTSQQLYTQNLWRRLDGGIKYHKADIRDPAHFLQPYSAEAMALAQADIILLPFVLSAIKENEDCSTAIQNVLEAMKPGAILIYIDTVKSGCTETINELAYWCGLRRIYFMMEMSADLPNYEKKEYLDAYAKEFETEPVRNAKVASIVFKRPSACEFERRGRITERERKNIQQAQTRLRKKNPSFRFFQPS